jgi:hypothetical protein
MFMPKKRPPSKRYNLREVKTAAGSVQHITPQEKSSVREGYTTASKPGSFKERKPGMRRVRMAAYLTGGAGMAAPNYVVTVGGTIDESDGIPFEEPIDVHLSFLLSREELIDAMADSKTATEFANNLGAYGEANWTDVNEVSFTQAH